MKLPWLKRYLPRSLFSRTLLIFAVPIITVQLVVTVLFIQRHYAGVTEQMTQAVAVELIYAAETVEAAPDAREAQQRLDALAIPLGLFLTLTDGSIRPRESVAFYDVSGNSLVDTLADRIQRPMAIDLTTDDKVVFVRIETQKGILEAEVPRRRMVASNPHLLLVWMLVTSAVLSAIAVLFLRNQVKPIRQLAHASEEFGKGRTVRFRPAGAEEIRRAGAAFLSMRARIERQIDQRTRMLSGVSHDLRTPLTRMKLALAVAEPCQEVDELGRDVDEMERMLEGFLAFARGEGAEEAEETDPIAIAELIGADARRTGRTVAVASTTDTPQNTLVLLRPVAVKRSVQNLVDNALTYGREVALSVRLLPKFVEFIVEDDGPGIDEAAREEAMRPFVRLDRARNQDAGGGVGLGLSIAMDVARSHGGTLELGASERLGGLRAVLRLPR
ncbi:ATP-binding protein [Oceanicella sp. SM1341]|uniref:ATP-binding protein n=1 Tax=Oceanicella sp. SM1341 TaxID=1548889 RepID=UPI000E54084C|nr:ATP-binding protein [Oceanicella sp. SM1341]